MDHLNETAPAPPEPPPTRKPPQPDRNRLTTSQRPNLQHNIANIIQTLLSIDGRVRELGLSPNARNRQLSTSDTNQLLGLVSQAIGGLAMVTTRLSADVHAEPVASAIKKATPDGTKPPQTKPAKRREAQQSPPLSLASPTPKPRRSLTQVPPSSGSDSEADWVNVERRKKKPVSQSKTPSFADMARQNSRPAKPKPPPSKTETTPRGPATRKITYDTKSTVVVSYINTDPTNTVKDLRGILLTRVKPLLKDVDVVSMRAKLRGVAFLLECATPADRDKILKCDQLEQLGLKASLPRSPAIP